MPHLCIKKEDILLSKPIKNENEQNEKKEAQEEREQKQKQLFHALTFKALEHQDYELVKALLFYAYFLDAKTLRQAKTLKNLSQQSQILQCFLNLYGLHQSLIQQYVNTEITLPEMNKKILDGEEQWLADQIENFKNSPMFYGSMFEIDVLSKKDRIDKFVDQVNREFDRVNKPAIRKISDARKYLTFIKKKIEEITEVCAKLNIQKQELAIQLQINKASIDEQRWEIINARLENRADYDEEEINELKNWVLDIKVPIDIEDPNTGNTLLHAFLLYLNKEITYEKLKPFERFIPISSSSEIETIKMESVGEEQKKRKEAARERQQGWSYHTDSSLEWQILCVLLEYLPLEPIAQKKEDACNNENDDKNKNTQINLATHQNHDGKTVLDLAWDRNDTYFILALMNHFPFSINKYLDCSDKTDTLLHRAKRDDNEALVMHLVAHYQLNLDDDPEEIDYRWNYDSNRDRSQAKEAELKKKEEELKHLEEWNLEKKETTRTSVWSEPKKSALLFEQSLATDEDEVLTKESSGPGFKSDSED